MANEYKGLTIKFEGDSVGLVAALGKIKAASRESNREVRTLQAALKTATQVDSSKVALLNERLKSQEAVVRSSREKVDALKQAQDDLAASGDTTSAAYQRLTKDLSVAETYLYRDRKALTEFAEAATPMGQAAENMRQWGAAVKDAGGKIEKLGGAFSSVGQTLTVGVSLPMVATAGVAVQSAVDIDTAWYGVRKTVDATEEKYQQLKDSAIELSKTQPVSAETLLNIEALGGQLGISTDNLEEFARVISGIDIATDLDAETAATELSRFMNITGLSQDKVSNLGSTLVDLGNHFATTESDIMHMAMRLASAGAQAGMTDADILGLSTSLSSMGMRAEAGGSALSRVINDINGAVATGSEKLSDYAAVAGMSADEFASAWRDNAANAFSDFLVGVAQVGDEAGSTQVVLDELGITEIRTSDAMRRLAGNTDLVKDAIGRANTAFGENTALTDEVNERNNSLASRFEVLKNRMTAIAEEVGKPLAEALLDLVDAAEPLIKGVGDLASGFAAMDKSQQQAIVKSAAMVAAIGPLMSVLGGVTSVAGKTVSGIGSIATGMGNAVGRINGFRTALTTTNPEIISAYKHTGTWTDRLAVSMNRSKGASKALDTLGGAYRKSTANAAPFVDSLGKERDALAKATTKFGGYKAVIGTTDTKTKRFTGGTVDLTNRLTEQRSAADKVATAFGGVVSAVAAVGTVASIGSMFLEVANAAHKAAIGYDEVMDAADAASGKADEFVQSMGSTQGAAIDLGLALSSSGKSVTGLNDTTAQAFANIVAIVQRDMAEAGHITEDGANEIANNFQKILDASNEKTGAFVNQINAIPKRFENLDSSNVSQYIADVSSAFDQGKQEIDNTLQQQLTAIESYHTTAGTVGSEAYNKQVQEAQDNAAKNIEILEGAKNDALRLTGERFSDMDETTSSGWDKLSSTAREKAREWSEVQLDFVGDTKAEYEKEFSELASTIDYNTTAAWLKAQAATVAAGGPLGDASKESVKKITDAFDGLPDYMQDDAVKFLKPLAEAIEQGGVELGDLGSMSAQQIVDAINDKLVEGMGNAEDTAKSSGKNTTAAFATGMRSNNQQVSSAAKSAYDVAIGKISPLQGALNSAGAKSASNLASGLTSGQSQVSGAGNSLYNAARGPVSPLPGSLRATGSSASSGFASGLGAYAGLAGQNARNMAAQVSNMKPGNTYQWGADASQNFAAGIAAGVQRAKDAAFSVAKAVADILHHTTPEYGPMADDDVWGLHFIENFSDGMAAGIPELRRAACAAADAASFEPVAYRQAWAYDAGRSHVSGSPTVAANTGDTINQQFTINANDPSLVASVVAARERQARR